MKHLYILGSLLLITSIFLNFHNPTDAQSQTTRQLSGYAWSSNVGWISFQDSVVTVNPDNTLSGYAWSSNVGWLQFGGLSNFPTRDSGAISSNAKIENNKIVGWAKFVGATSGWDGWVLLSGTNHSIGFNGDRFSGYAWGDDVVGWIDFSGVSLKTENGVCSAVIDQCNSGRYAPGTDTASEEKWMCLGINGGTNASCSQPLDNGETLACTASPNPVQKNQTVTYVASPTGGTYEWFVGQNSSGTLISGETQSTYVTSYPVIGSYNRTVRMTKNGSTQEAVCNTVTVGCGPRPADEVCGPGDTTHTVYGSCKSDGTYASSEVSCGGGGSATPPTATFRFSPNIIQSGQTCKLYLEAKNSDYCYLANRQGVDVTGDMLGTAGNVSVAGTIGVPVGTYTLWCANIVLGKEFELETKSCVSNPDIREN